MLAKFQVAGFQNIRHRYLDFVCLFLLGHSPVQVNCYFSEIQAIVEDFRPIN